MKRWLIGFAVLAMLALSLMTWNDAHTGARAWLCAFVLVSTIPIGSLALLLVWGISGGRWGEDLGPVLVPAARTMPLLLLAFVPVIALRPLIYDWHALKLPHDVHALYLNSLFFDARTVIGITAWSVLAWTGAWRNPLGAALGLLTHFVLMTFLPADWVLTIQPGSISAGFGMGFGIEQMFAALAVAAIVARQQSGRPTRDLAGIMVTSLLGAVYFFYMAFLITWYGNVPEKVHWYVARTSTGWPAVMLVAFLIGAAVPFIAILNPYVRREPAAMRLVGACALAGIVMHVAWMTVPAFGNVTVVPAIFAGLAMALALWRAASPRPVRQGAHGG